MAAGWSFRGIAVEVITNPAAGADFVFTLTANHLRQGVAARKLVAFMGVYTSSGVVANREVVIRVDDGTANPRVESLFNSVIVASQTRRLCGSVGYGVLTTSAVAAKEIETSLNDGGWLLAAGDRVQSVTLNKDAGDQWSGIRLVFEEWG